MSHAVRGGTFFVTGEAGSIGSGVIRHLLDETEAYVVNIDKLNYASNLSQSHEPRTIPVIARATKVS